MTLARVHTSFQSSYTYNKLTHSFKKTQTNKKQKTKNHYIDIDPDFFTEYTTLCDLYA